MASNGTKALAAAGTIGSGSAATTLAVTYGSGNGSNLDIPSNDVHTNNESIEEPNPTPKPKTEIKQQPIETQPLVNKEPEEPKELKKPSIEPSVKEQLPNKPQQEDKKPEVLPPLKTDIPENKLPPRIETSTNGVEWVPGLDYSSYGFLSSENHEDTSTTTPLEKNFGIFLIKDTENKDLWDKKLALLEQDKSNPEKEKTINSIFKTANKAFGDSENDSLNKICKKIYGYSFSGTFFVTYGSDSDPSFEYKWDYFTDFLRYCSFQDEPFSLIPDRFTDPDNEDEADEYIDYMYQAWFFNTETNKNNLFWQIKQDWYDQLKTKPEEDDFNKYYESKKSLIDVENKFSLRNFCSYATKEKTDGSVIKTLTVLKYCSYWDDYFETWFEEDGFTEKTTSS